MTEQSPGEEALRAAVRESVDKNHREPVALAGETIALLRSEMRLAVEDALTGDAAADVLRRALSSAVADENIAETKRSLQLLLSLAILVVQDRAYRGTGSWIWGMVRGAFKHLFMFVALGAIAYKLGGLSTMISIWRFLIDGRPS